MKKKRVLLLITSMVFILGACGQSSYNKEMAATTAESAAMDSGFSYDEYEESYDADMSEEAAEGGVEDDSIAQESAASEYMQKLIKNYSFSFETTEFDNSMNFIREQVTKYQGYIENSDTYGSSRKSANMTIRIPEKQAEAFLNETGKIGEMIQKSESSEDITLKYYDTKARLESLQTQHERLLELLEKAESLEDVVALETHLSEVEYQIDSYGSQLKVYDNLVNYVTISINLEEVSQIQVVEDDGFLTQIKKGLSRNTADVLDSLVAFAIFIITAIPYLIVFGIIGGIIYAVIRRIHKKRKNKKKEEQYQQSEQTIKKENKE